MNHDKQQLGALAMDLKRVALGYHRGSTKMAERFLEEALKRQRELKFIKNPPYLNKLLKSLTKLAKEKNKEKLAEDALMYSTLFQNYAIKLRQP
ncbi:hypothetical protein A3A54_00350 [Candidatus Curtissbacteria bacterium RIFCSPLOWO2_01_FULL_39_62]|uniref:HEPN domain-containing protein n=2 Tax=Candidatus Curtissiibacteriota TaxID=1752717 RepID=A0A1F5G7E0_9BACT|nr:MAG: hypothetical protein A2775_00045 [Candidatus Curtissbacteria bacterium RIFCSPHIGHO2_01_FULL_39_57]OGD87782.1 MAG: hypothetical protein A3D04_02315 [Candidatus Curtissbacteria bacterium RIFCSPHIGHO2_02_FULL_40_16b]OGD90014.1 MAG: hypothetical protein A3E11_02225 [Candidatus Curtissbacteria bacterium RIFCSPHIGHO2_12_FULL_38_37]OGD99847.1 MAG: hypothetical protein A3J17_04695 [Candidatus Curtissbacteria bacterium RIFCSPLOWO2_02_FULL_40_11]OGE02655.1 MAG: hypothetical protein A3A54_00350 [C